MKRLFLTTLLTITVLFAGVYGLINRVPSESIKVDAGTSIAEPLAFIQQARLISGATADSFSTSVAISGSTAVVYSASGFFVFFRSDTTWSQQAVLVPSSGMGVASGNRSVAIDGDTIVIGGSGAEIIPGIVQGAAYVFVRNGSTWTEQQRLAADDGAAGDNFGRSVAINGGTIVVGANTDDVDPNGDQGSAYVFARSGGIWSQQARLIASDGEPAHGFGINVAIDVDTVIVSSRIGSVNGSIYVFFRTGATWSEQQRLSNCEPSGSTGTSCNFGAAISISGDTIAAGNRSLNVDGRTSQGGVYIFVRNATTWTLEQKITDSNGAASDGLGNAVSLSGNSLAVSTAAVVTPLAVYIYGRSGSTWSMSQPRIQFPAQTTVGLDRKMVSISGNRFIFGVSRDITSPNVIGAAYIHWNGVEDPTPTPTPTPTLTPTPTISPTPTPSASPTPPLTVSVSGRVTTPGGLGLRNAVVSLTNSQNVRQTATTSSFGVYSFGNVMPGEIYVVGVSSKRYRFASQSLVVNSDMTNVDFVGLE